MQKMMLFMMLSGMFIFAEAVTSDFTTGVDSWRVEGDGEFSWEAVTGNPGGCFRVDDYACNDMVYAYAPHKFLGDWSVAAEADTLSADIYLGSSGNDYVIPNFVFKIIGPGGMAKAILDPTPPEFNWITYSVPIAESQWTVVWGNWNDILDNVEAMIVTPEYINGDEFDRLDNVNLTFDPIGIPVQNGVISDFEQIGYDGWYVINATGVSNETGGGNPSRFLYVDGNSDFTVGVAPPKFCGSWQLVENSSAVLVDLKKLSANVNSQTPPYLFKISGENGEAIYPVPDDFNLELGRWITVAAMIKEEDWTMLSGEWNNLIANVSDVRIALDFYDSQSEIGMDNFRINNEPPETHFLADNTEVILGEEITFTDYTTNAPDSWFWQFGDNTTGILPNPHHTYQEAGIYDVTLTTENMFGADTLTKVAYITVMLPAPENLNISVVADSVHLQWNSVYGADFYKIYGADDPSAVFDNLDVVTDTTWTANISGLEKRFYYVTAGKQ